jgi:hypothetical protein
MEVHLFIDSFQGSKVVSDRQAYLSGITGYSGVEAIADKKIKQ